MLKDYNKTVTVKAEEFRGDPEMISKYDIFPDYSTGEVKYFIRDTPIEVGDYILVEEAVEGSGAYKVVAQEDFFKEYSEKPDIVVGGVAGAKSLLSRAGRADLVDNDKVVEGLLAVLGYFGWNTKD